MAPIHLHGIDHVTRAALAIATTGTAFPLPLAWLLPAAGGILLPRASGGPAPNPVLLGSLAYSVAFVGWLSWVAAGGGARATRVVPTGAPRQGP